MATEEIRIERPGLPQVHECPKQRPQVIGCEPAQFRFAHGELLGRQEVGDQGGNEFRAGGGHALELLAYCGSPHQVVLEHAIGVGHGIVGGDGGNHIPVFHDFAVGDAPQIVVDHGLPEGAFGPGESGLCWA